MSRHNHRRDFEKGLRDDLGRVLPAPGAIRDALNDEAAYLTTAEILSVVGRQTPRVLARNRTRNYRSAWNPRRLAIPLWASAAVAVVSVAVLWIPGRSATTTVAEVESTYVIDGVEREVATIFEETELFLDEINETVAAELIARSE